VAVGERVSAGQPVASLESMKMVSTLTAPLDGHVTALAVLPHQQVEKGDPLLRIKSTETSRLMPDLPGRTVDRAVDLAALVVEDDAPPPDLFDDLTAYLLGFDLDPRAVNALPTSYRRRLERVLARYGVDGLGDRAWLERATFWLFRSFSRVPELADLVTEVLGRRLQFAGELSTRATAADRGRLERLGR